MVFDPASYEAKVAEYFARMRGAQGPEVAPTYAAEGEIAAASPSPYQSLVPIAGRIAARNLLSGAGSGALPSIPSATIGPIPEFGMSGASAAAPEATSISNFAGSATPYLGAAGVAAGGYNAYQGIRNKNPTQAGLGGLGAGLGLNAMGYALGPWGWAAMAAAPVVASMVNKFTDKDRWEAEGKRLRALQGRGINIDPAVLAMMPTQGRSKEELINLAQQAGGNVAFAGSRNESDLTGKDLVHYAFLPEKYGNDYQNASLDTKLKIGDALVKAQAVDEGRGTINFNKNFNDALDQKIKEFLGK